MREKIEEAIIAALNAAQERERSGTSSNLYPLLPLALWEFSGLHDDAAPGSLIAPEGDDIDQERLADDMCMLRALYDDIMLQVEGGPTEVILACAAAMWPGSDKEKELAAVLNTYDAFDGVGTIAVSSVQDALASLALALQSTFDYDEADGQYATFNYEDALNLAIQTSNLKYKGAAGNAAIEMQLHLSLLTPVLDIPMTTYSEDARELFAQHCITVLKRVGSLLLPYLFSA